MSKQYIWLTENYILNGFTPSISGVGVLQAHTIIIKFVDFQAPTCHMFLVDLLAPTEPLLLSHPTWGNNSENDETYFMPCMINSELLFSNML